MMFVCIILLHRSMELGAAPDTSTGVCLYVVRLLGLSIRKSLRYTQNPTQKQTQASECTIRLHSIVWRLVVIAS